MELPRGDGSGRTVRPDSDSVSVPSGGQRVADTGDEVLAFIRDWLDDIRLGVKDKVGTFVSFGMLFAEVNKATIF